MSPLRRTIDFISGFSGISKKERGFRLPLQYQCLGQPPFNQPYFETGRTDYTYTNSNRTIQKTGGPSQVSIVAGAAKSSGKWYIEFNQASAAGSSEANDWQYGMATAGSNSGYLGSYASSLGIQSATDFANGFTGIAARTRTATVPNPAATIGLAYDADAKKFWISIDGTYISGGDPVAGTNPNAYGWSNSLALYPAIRAYQPSSVTMTIPTSWAYQPSGYNEWA